jgi:hypothetical protein
VVSVEEHVLVTLTWDWCCHMHRLGHTMSPHAASERSLLGLLDPGVLAVGAVVLVHLLHRTVHGGVELG